MIEYMKLWKYSGILLSATGIIHIVVAIARLVTGNLVIKHQTHEIAGKTIVKVYQPYSFHSTILSGAVAIAPFWWGDLLPSCGLSCGLNGQH